MIIPRLNYQSARILVKELLHFSSEGVKIWTYKIFNKRAGEFSSDPFPESYNSTTAALEKLDLQNSNLLILKKTDNQELLAWCMNILDDYIYQSSTLLKCDITTAATPPFSDREMSTEELKICVGVCARACFVHLVWMNEDDLSS